VLKPILTNILSYNGINDNKPPEIIPRVVEHG
jgi:hypothetical protein